MQRRESIQDAGWLAVGDTAGQASSIRADGREEEHGQAVAVTVREEIRSEVTASPGLDAQKPWQLQAPLDVVCHRALGENWLAAKEVRALSNNREPATCTISTMVPSADRSCAHKNRKILLSKGDRPPEVRKYHTVTMASARYGTSYHASRAASRPHGKTLPSH